MLRENAAHHFLLNALPAPVDEAHFLKTGLARGIEVRLDDRRNVPRREAVKIDAVFDRHAHRVGEGFIGVRRHGIWRKCVGIEPTAPTVKRAPSDLKSVEATRPQSLPARRNASYQRSLHQWSPQARKAASGFVTQLEMSGQLDFLKLPYHQAILNGEVNAESSTLAELTRHGVGT